MPGANNCPVLGNAERARVGTIYKQRSPFEARKIGAALASANIARHIQERFLQRPREWRPLVYCWRGGERSGAFAQVLSRVGWQVSQLEGGYRSYRRAVIADLEQLPRAFRLCVVCGLTGTGKSRLLRALREAGGQVLDLEALAAHRGSVLGNLPDAPQPGQKMFESLIWSALGKFDPGRVVYVEAESKKIGVLRVPAALIDTMWKSECIVLESPIAVRVGLLKQEYVHFLERPQELFARLDCLVPLHGHAVIDKWKELATACRWDELTADLLASHYDPAYNRAIHHHYPALPRAAKLRLDRADDEAFAALARRCLDSESVLERVTA